MTTTSEERVQVAEPVEESAEESVEEQAEEAASDDDDARRRVRLRVEVSLWASYPVESSSRSARRLFFWFSATGLPAK